MKAFETPVGDQKTPLKKHKIFTKAADTSILQRTNEA